jgi:cyclopropane fatty-acyl-phospholipid synthase-like methyltransferase
MVSYDEWYLCVGQSPSAYQQVLEHVFGPGQFVGQQGFAARSEILELCNHVGAAPGTCLLDVASGCGGPARSIAQATGCHVIGIDLSLAAPAWRAAAALAMRIS